MEKFINKLHQPGNEKLLRIHRENHCSAVKKYRQKIFQSPSKATEYRLKNCQQAKAYREKKKTLKMISNEIAFKTPKALFKAVGKAEKSLPEAAAKRQAVVKVLADRANLSVCTTHPIQLKHPRKSFIGVEELVLNFFELQAVSRQLPGKIDFVFVKNKNGQKEKIQKRLLLTTVLEAHKKFKEMYPDREISLSKFHELRPKHVILISKASQNICLCIYCENINFLFNSLREFLNFDAKRISELICELMCDQDSFSCASGKCTYCSNSSENIKNLIPSESFNKEIKFQRWEKVDGFMLKTTQDNETVENVMEMFCKNLSYFKLHKYLIKSQSEFLDWTRKNQEGNEAIIIIDYSQNYTAKSQDEIQSAYFAQRQISLFTAYAYVGKSSTFPYIIVSDDIAHSKHQVFSYLGMIIKDLRKNQPNLKLVRAMSDGCAQQFKNKFTLLNLVHAKEDFGVEMEWHFFPTSHGKSPADGLGGTFKRNIFDRVKTGKIEVTNAFEFFTEAQKFSSKTKILHSTGEDAQKHQEMLDKRWKNVKTISGTRDLHFFSSSDKKGFLKVAVSSSMDGLKTIKI